MKKNTGILRRSGPGLLLLLLHCTLPVSHAQVEIDSAAEGRRLLGQGMELAKRESFDSAAVVSRSAAALLIRHDWEGYLASANLECKALIGEGKIDSAEATIRESFVLAAPALPAKSLAIAEAQAQFSYFHSYHDQPDSAIADDLLSIGIRQTLLGCASPVLAGNYYTLGLAFRKKGLYGPALEDFRTSLRLYAAGGKATAFSAAILMQIGNVRRERAEYDEAFASLDSAVGLLRRLGLRQSNSMITGLLYLALCHSTVGRLNEAAALYDTAATLAASLYPGNQAMVVGIRTSKGRVYAQMGDLDRALDAYDDGLLRTAKFGLGNASGTGEIHQYAAEALVEKGDIDAALEHAETALALKLKALGNDHPDIAAAREVLAGVQEARGDHAAALASLRDALRIKLLQREGTARLDAASLMLKTAEAYKGLGRLDSAESAVSRALACVGKSNYVNAALTARIHEALADIRFAGKSPLEAAAQYDSAVSALFPGFLEADRHLDENPVDLARGVHLVRILRKKGVCLESVAHNLREPAGALEGALQAYDRAGRTILALRGNYETEGSKTRLIERSAEIFENGVRVALRLHDLTGKPEYLASAFSFAELNKAGMLLEGMREARVKHFAGVPESLLASEHSLKTELTACELQLAKSMERSGPDTLRTRGLQWRALTLRESLRRTREQMRIISPAYAHLFEEEKGSLLERVQRTLDDSTLVVEYFLGDAGAYVFTIGRDGADVRTLHTSANVCALAQSLARTIRSVDRQNFISASAQLHASVIGPIARAVAAHNRLVFIPDKDLTRIPFEVLVPRTPAAGPDQNIAYTELPFLLKSHEIVVAPSARIYCETAERSSHERPQLMSFAGFAPVFRESTATGMILASNQFARDLDTTELRSFSVEGKRFRELAYSDAEVNGIAGEFMQKGLPARVLVNGMATEQNFKRYAPSASFIHVATHGVVNERDPRRSALVFVQPADTTTGEDGVLYAAETYNLELNADLVVLSCCESGIGPFVNGEGVYAMMRGFLYSGARNVMYSLWQVMDHHTSELMQSFYEGVLKGWRFGQALRMAKLQMLSRERTAFPFCWAGFVLVGQ